MGLEDVDYDRPPRGKLFDDFHMTRTQVPPSRVTTLSPDIPMVANPIANAFTAMMMGMAGWRNRRFLAALCTNHPLCRVGQRTVATQGLLTRGLTHFYARSRLSIQNGTW